MSKREQLARVLCKAERPIVNPDAIDKKVSWDIVRGADGLPQQMAWQPVKEWHKRLYLVDAILAELREPDEKMLTKGHAEGVRKNYFWERINEQQAHGMRREYLPTAWQAMIDAIE